MVTRTVYGIQTRGEARFRVPPVRLRKIYTSGGCSNLRDVCPSYLGTISGPKLLPVLEGKVGAELLHTLEPFSHWENPVVEGVGILRPTQSTSDIKEGQFVRNYCPFLSSLPCVKYNLPGSRCTFGPHLKSEGVSGVSYSLIRSSPTILLPWSLFSSSRM